MEHGNGASVGEVNEEGLEGFVVVQMSNSLGGHGKRPLAEVSQDGLERNKFRSTSGIGKMNANNQ